MSSAEASLIAGVLFWSVVVFLGACLLCLAAVAWDARHAWNEDEGRRS